jgi:Recombination endonuclease VII
MNIKARSKYLLDNFKMLLVDWLKLWEHQEGKCAICGNKLIKANTDHDHASGEVRGLLCARCNRALGRFGDRLDLLLSACAYLREPPARVALGRIHIGYPGRIGTKKHRKMVAKLRKQAELAVSNQKVAGPRSTEKH